MNRIECERLVERYLEGKMDFTEEHDFFIQVAVDNELRRTLKSYQILDSSIRKERDANVQAHSEARMRVASMVSRRLVEESARGPIAAMMQEAGPAAQGAVGGSAIGRWIITGIAAVGVGVGALMMSEGQPDRQEKGTIERGGAIPARIEQSHITPDQAPVISDRPTNGSPKQGSNGTAVQEPRSTSVTRSVTPTPTVDDRTTSGIRIVEGSHDPSHGTADSILRSVPAQDTIRLPFAIDGDLPK